MRAHAVFLLLLSACAAGSVTPDDGEPDAGQDELVPPVDGWTCAASRYDIDDICDCECGAVDPDCADPLAQVKGCEAHNSIAPYCGATAQCEDHCLDTPVEGVCLPDGRLSVCFVPEEEGQRPEIMTQACPPGSRCNEDPFGARCVATGECITGTTICASSTQLKTCTNGAWISSTCSPGQCTTNPGVGATCSSGPSAATITGRVRYEMRDRADDLDGYGSITVADGAGLLAVVTDGSQTLGSAVAGADGSFSVSVSSMPSASARITFFPHMDDGAGRTLFTVGRAIASCRDSSADCTQNSTSAGAWGWATNLSSRTNVGTITITEGEGSGAIHIFEWMRFGLNKVRGLYGDSVPRTVMAVWEPGMSWGCGACFMNWPGTMATSTFYDTSIVIGGEDGGETHWSKSVIMHELGHWVMATYSKTPNEGGPHTVLSVSRPGLAWSEGWASYFGQTSIGEREGAPEPLYFDRQNGNAFWINLEEVTASGGSFTMPKLTDPMDQYINEFVVASMLWDLGDPASTGEPAAMGDEEVHMGIRTARLRGTVNRGYAKVDLVDYLDGILCESMISGTTLATVIRNVFKFPYDGTPSCGTQPLAPFRLEVAAIGREIHVRPVGDVPPVMIVVEGRRVLGVGAAVTKAGNAEVFQLEDAPTPDRPVRIVARVLPSAAFGSTVVTELPARPRRFGPVMERLADPVQLQHLNVTEVVPLAR
jgi:hypothetical protein